MFDDVPQSTPPQRPVQDMFAATAPTGGSPLRPLTTPAGAVPPTDHLNTMPGVSHGINKKYLLIGGGSLVALIIILIVVYSLLSNINQPASVANLPINNPPVNQAANQPPANNIATATPTLPPPATTTTLPTNNVATTTDASATLDSDNDGLTDAKEAIYGTDVYNPDTDGDGYQDGFEVNGGYNPLGSGKLK